MKIALVIVAIVCFALATIGMNINHVHLVPLGLALWAGSTLV